jgi:hypothetical protein
MAAFTRPSTKVRSMAFPSVPELESQVQAAVRYYWTSRGGQSSKQLASTIRDAGRRNEVTGGGHLDRFCSIFAEITHFAGFDKEHVRVKSGLELPGFFRPTKQWDVVVSRRGRLVAAMEMKSQAGPSFGNNFNNRTEEAIGNAVDLIHAFNAGAVGKHPPFIGYLFLLEDHPKSRAPTRASSDIFPPLPKFAAASYAKRYELLISGLVDAGLYNAGCLLLSPRGDRGRYNEPNLNLSFRRLARAFYDHLRSCD